MKQPRRRRVDASPLIDDYVAERRRSLFDGTARYRVDATFGKWSDGRRQEPEPKAITLPKVKGL